MQKELEITNIFFLRIIKLFFAARNKCKSMIEKLSTRQSFFHKNSLNFKIEFQPFLIQVLSVGPLSGTFDLQLA